MGNAIKDPIDYAIKFLKEHRLSEDKMSLLRVLGCAVVSSGGIPDESLKEVCNYCDLNPFRTFIENFSRFGVRVSYDGKKNIADLPQRIDSGNPSLTKYDLSRWTPIVKDVMMDAITGILSKKQYPAISEEPPESMLKNPNRKSRWR